MDFGDILDQWEQMKHKPTAKEKSLESLYDAYAPTDKDIKKDEIEGEAPADQPADKRAAPEAELDLHGLTAEEAQRQVHAFLEASSKLGRRKVIIVHGKGYHSKNGNPVLRKVVHTCLEQSPFAGKTGRPPRELGGSGAVWVMIKQKKR